MVRMPGMRVAVDGDQYDIPPWSIGVSRRSPFDEAGVQPSIARPPRPGTMLYCLSVEGVDYEAWIGTTESYDEQLMAFKRVALELLEETGRSHEPDNRITVERYPMAGWEIVGRYDLLPVDDDEFVEYVKHRTGQVLPKGTQP